MELINVLEQHQQKTNNYYNLIDILQLCVVLARHVSIRRHMHDQIAYMHVPKSYYKLNVKS